MSENKVKIREGEDYITLNVLLKIVGVIPTGGMAKIYLQNNLVLVNNENEVRRGRKLYPGDAVLIEGIEYTIV